MKNIVICCDGTGNEFGRNNTNIVLTCMLAQKDEQQVANGLHALAIDEVRLLGPRRPSASASMVWPTSWLGAASSYGSENDSSA